MIGAQLGIVIQYLYGHVQKLQGEVETIRYLKEKVMKHDSSFAVMKAEIADLQREVGKLKKQVE